MTMRCRAQLYMVIGLVPQSMLVFGQTRKWLVRLVWPRVNVANGMGKSLDIVRKTGHGLLGKSYTASLKAQKVNLPQ